jgi:hypothetical protein
MEPNHATTDSAHLDNYRWLISEEAQPWLDRDADSAASPLRLIAEFRQHLSAGQVHLLMQQMELRRRALKTGKFPDARRMFFTPRLLEQATSHAVASYKAQRFTPNRHIADLCCGIGGDLLAIAERCFATGIDRDCVATTLAAANCNALGCARATVATGDVSDFPIQECAAWHIDPDRRARGHRTTRLEYYEPNLERIQQLLSRAGSAAIKLAPAAQVPQGWADDAELEWIGEDRECKQQVAWFGELARHPGMRAATILHGLGTPPATVVGQPNDDAVPRATTVGGYVYEPHATVLAAGLVNVLAGRHGLKSVSPDLGYLTGDTRIVVSAAAAFEVAEVLPLDTKRVKAALRRFQAGRLEIKKRGIEIEPQKLRRQLRVPGDQKRILLLTRFCDRSIAIVAQRVGAA